MGGASPNLADLVSQYPLPPHTLYYLIHTQAVYGPLRATEGLPTFKDIQANTKIGPWYSAMSELVNQPSPMT